MPALPGISEKAGRPGFGSAMGRQVHGVRAAQIPTNYAPVSIMLVSIGVIVANVQLLLGARIAGKNQSCRQQAKCENQCEKYSSVHFGDFQFFETVTFSSGTHSDVHKRV
jgi:hypothetical protein